MDTQVPALPLIRKYKNCLNSLAFRSVVNGAVFPLPAIGTWSKRLPGLKKRVNKEPSLRERCPACLAPGLCAPDYFKKKFYATRNMAYLEYERNGSSFYIRAGDNRLQGSAGIPHWTARFLGEGGPHCGARPPRGTKLSIAGTPGFDQASLTASRAHRADGRPGCGTSTEEDDVFINALTLAPSGQASLSQRLFSGRRTLAPASKAICQAEGRQSSTMVESSSIPAPATSIR